MSIKRSSIKKAFEEARDAAFRRKRAQAMSEKLLWRCPECGERYYETAPQVCVRCGNERER